MFSPRFLAHRVSFHMPSGVCDASSICFRWAIFRAFFITRPFWFLATLYAFRLSSVCSRLFWRFRRLVSICMSLHCRVHPSLNLGERYLIGLDSLIARSIARTTSSVYRSSAVLVFGRRWCGRCRSNVLRSFLSSVSFQFRVGFG